MASVPSLLFVSAVASQGTTGRRCLRRLVLQLQLARIVHPKRHLQHSTQLSIYHRAKVRRQDQRAGKHACGYTLHYGVISGARVNWIRGEGRQGLGGRGRLEEMIAHSGRSGVVAVN